MLERLGVLFRDQVWPIFLEVLTQPLLWLAVAALVYGSRVLSLAELWRRGQPYAARVPGASVFARYAEKRALRQVGPPPRGVRLAAAQTRQAFFGDLDDKYLPTFHSLRLVLRAGVLFLGSYILAYALVLIAQNYFETLLNWIVGGQGYIFWVRWEPAFAVLTEAPFETLRLCLLAVAFRRCLELFSQRVEAAAATPAPDRQPAGSRLMVLQRSRLVRVLVAIALVALAAVGLRLSEGDDGGSRSSAASAASRWPSTTGRSPRPDVRVGTSLSREGEVYAITPGLFVVVRVEVAATGERKLPGYNARVLTGSRRYDAFTARTVGNVPPGFATEQDVVVEVDPAVLADITLELDPSELLTAYPEHARIHLGITEENAEAWRAAGRDQVVETVDQSSRGIWAQP